MFYEFHTVPTRDNAGVITRESVRFTLNERWIVGVDLPPADSPDCGCIIAGPEGGSSRVVESYDEVKSALGVKYVGLPNFSVSPIAK